jgi:hypothetical protein
MMNYEPIFENSVNARLLVKLTQYTIIVFWRNVEQYFHGARTSNPVDYGKVGAIPKRTLQDHSLQEPSARLGDTGSAS